MLVIRVMALTGNRTPVVLSGELRLFSYCAVLIQENHQRVNIFFDYAKKTKNTAWSYFLPMLNRQDLFTVHMVS